MRSLVFIVLLTSSCISTKKLMRPHQDQTTTGFENNINGVYQNVDTTLNFGNSSLLNILYEKMFTKFPNEWPDLQVHVSYEDEKIFFKGYSGDSLVYENDIWGNMYENRFTSHRKFMILPLILFNMQKESRILLYVDDHGMLHATHRGYYWYLVAVQGSQGDSQIYERYGQFRKIGELPNPFD